MLKSILIVLAIPCVAFAQTEFTNDPRLGVCTHFSQGWDAQKIMPLIEKAGIGWIRDDLGWEGIESKKGVYHVPDRTMAWIRAGHANHVRVLLILNGSNKLYADRYDPEAFAKWAAWTVTELKNDIDAVEILNEPNNFGFSKYYGGKHEGEGDSPWVAKYVTLMNTAAEAIKAANPKMPVIGFGAGPAVTYKQLDLKTSPAVDGLADHPYSNHLPPELLPGGGAAEQLKHFGFSFTDDRGSFASVIQGFRAKSERSGGPKGIWLTEWGYSTYQPLSAGQFGGFTESAQAKYILRRFVEGLGLGVDVSFLYEFRDGNNDHDAEERWGLVHADGSPKPSFEAVVNLSQIIHGLKAAGKDQVGAVNVFPIATSEQNGPIAAYRFIDEQGRPAVALWATDRANGDLQPRVADVELLWGDAVKTLESVDTLTGKIEAVSFKRVGQRLLKDAMIIRDYPIFIRTTGGAAVVGTKPAGDAQTALNLFENTKWSFTNGQEFPGAAGSFATGKEGETPTGVINYDFSKGGAYVSSQTDIPIPATASEFRVNARSPQALRLTVRLIDSTGQCHQYVSSCSGTGAWETLRLPLDRRASEHWGGANDGKLHFPVKTICLCVNKPGGNVVSGKVEFADGVTLNN
jgi:hypothetical protein